MNQTEINSANKQMSNLSSQNMNDHLSVEKDLQTEHILASGSTTPIGQLLEKIAQLPQVRQQKVLSVRRKLSQGKYEVDDMLDTALDKILDELLI